MVGDTVTTGFRKPKRDGVYQTGQLAAPPVPSPAPGRNRLVGHLFDRQPQPERTSLAESQISIHYAPQDPLERIHATLQRHGLRFDALSRDDIAAFDEFHIGGRAQTRALAERARIDPETRVLDLGAGIGGPARTLAEEYRCRVTAVDLTEAFCRINALLNAQLGFGDRIDCLCADAVKLPFRAGSFDLVWFQHLTGNIADLAAVFAEVRRVLRSDGRMVFHEAVRGETSELHYPVFWAGAADHDNLVTAARLEAEIERAGLVPEFRIDTTEESRQLFRSALATPRAERPLLGLSVLVPDALVKAKNMLRNLESGALEVIQAGYRIG
ncbi:methyltransferase domain-containing protein [candidate division GN15 bacterium]|nr:methyltransferase domain-containing protein [candidate division GN15 bacterium]